MKLKVWDEEVGDWKYLKLHFGTLLWSYFLLELGRVFISLAILLFIGILLFLFGG